jgi:hypothetical protein
VSTVDLAMFPSCGAHRLRWLGKGLLRLMGRKDRLWVGMSRNASGAWQGGSQCAPDGGGCIISLDFTRRSVEREFTA